MCGGQAALQLAHAGGGGGGNGEPPARQARFQLAEQLQTDARFAHADGVQPEDRPSRQGGFELRRVTAKSLAQSAPASSRAATSSQNNMARSARKK